jgi:hypothetical protein
VEEIQAALRQVMADEVVKVRVQVEGAAPAEVAK